MKQTLKYKLKTCQPIELIKKAFGLHCSSYDKVLIYLGEDDDKDWTIIEVDSLNDIFNIGIILGIIVGTNLEKNT